MSATTRILLLVCIVSSQHLALAGNTDILWTVAQYEPMTVSVGDSITFIYSNNHDVQLHPTGTCDSTGAQLLGATDASPTTYTFTSPGTATFSCNIGDHCQRGMLLSVTVTDACTREEHETSMPTRILGRGATDTPAAQRFCEANHEQHEAMTVPFTGDAARDFVLVMIPHHQAGLTMCDLLSSGAGDAVDSVLLGICTSMQATMLADMEMMYEFLDSQGEDCLPAPRGSCSCSSDRNDIGDELGMCGMGGSVGGCGDVAAQHVQQICHSKYMMQAGMAIRYSGDYNVDFAMAMIPHHVGAKDLCTILLAASEPNSLDSGLASLCNGILLNMSAVISNLEVWLMDNAGCQFRQSCATDNNSDGRVDVADLLALLAEFGRSC